MKISELKKIIKTLVHEAQCKKGETSAKTGCTPADDTDYSQDARDKAVDAYNKKDTGIKFDKKADRRRPNMNPRSSDEMDKLHKADELEKKKKAAEKAKKSAEEKAKLDRGDFKIVPERLTKSNLQAIIREEIKHSLNEGGQGAQARSTAKELQKNLKDIRANGFDQDKYKKLITSIPAALADLANTLANMPQTAPNGTEAEELATAILILWDFSDEGMSHGFDGSFSKADRYLRWVRMYLEAYEEGHTSRIHVMLAKTSDSLTMIFQKAAKAVKSLKTDDSQNVFR